MAPAAASGSPYVESQIIMTAVRVITPFAFTYGLFLCFHGGKSPGGGFQGGAIIGTTVLMVAFAFGVEPTREWLANRTLVLLACGGTLAFALIGLVPLALRGRFLQHELFESVLGIPHGELYALEAVEIVGVAPIVASVVVGLFFVIAAGLLGGGTIGAAPDVESDGGERQ